MSTGLVFVGTTLHFSVFQFSIINATAGAAWVWIALHLRRRHVGLALERPAVVPAMN